MAVGLSGLPTLHPVAGIRIGTAELGGRAVPRDDLCVFEIAPGSVTGSVSRKAVSLPRLSSLRATT